MISKKTLDRMAWLYKVAEIDPKVHEKVSDERSVEYNMKIKLERFEGGNMIIERANNAVLEEVMRQKTKDLLEYVFLLADEDSDLAQGLIIEETKRRLGLKYKFSDITFKNIKERYSNGWIAEDFILVPKPKKLKGLRFK
jgi:hypothetical protein